MPPCSWPSSCTRPVTWTGYATAPTPATGMPPCGWPSCSKSAATRTAPCRYCARADVGDKHAAGRLTVLLRKAGDQDGLQARADAGDQAAARHLAELLAERGDLE